MILSCVTIVISTGGRKNLNDFSGFLMKKKLSTKFNNVHNINIDLCNVFASKLIHSSSNKHNDDSVFGLSIYFVENKESNLLINQEVCLKNSSNEICNKWQEKIVHFIDGISPGFLFVAKILIAVYCLCYFIYAW